MIIALLVGLAAIGLIFFLRNFGGESSVPMTSRVENAQEGTSSEATFAPEVVAENLSIPWDIGFLPEGGLLVTERSGNLVYIDAEGRRTNIAIPRAIHRGEGGLLGLALHPDFATNRLMYLYMTVAQGSLGTRNAVIRYRFADGSLGDERFIIDNIPGAAYHDGGRIRFGPDGFLYVTTGDTGNSSAAQDVASLSGKILRLRDDGSVPADNPFVGQSRAQAAIWSYGHRNPQGLAWDDAGRLWETEHGRSGIQSGLDEINLIIKGRNYGWPTIEGDATGSGMALPSAHSGASDTWAPASALFWNGSLFFGGLRGEALYEAVLRGEQVTEVRTHFKGEYGRIRTVLLGPDGMLYLTTSNRDGRGRTRADDDKIIRLNPSIFR